MTDIASFGFSIDTSQVSQASKDLRDLRTGSQDLALASKGVTTQFKEMNAETLRVVDANFKLERQIKTLADSQENYSKALQRGTTEAKLWDDGTKRITEASKRLEEHTKKTQENLDKLLAGSYYDKMSLQAKRASDTAKEFGRAMGVSEASVLGFNRAASNLKLSNEDAQTSFAVLTSAMNDNGSSADKARLVFEAYGVSLRKQNGEMRSAAQILADFADKTSKYADTRQKAIDIEIATGLKGVEALKALAAARGASVGDGEVKRDGKNQYFQDLRRQIEEETALYIKQREERRKAKEEYGRGRFTIFGAEIANFNPELKEFDKFLEKMNERLEQSHGIMMESGAAWDRFMARGIMSINSVSEYAKDLGKTIEDLFDNITGNYTPTAIKTRPEAPVAKPESALSNERESAMIRQMADAYLQSAEAVAKLKAEQAARALVVSGAIKPEQEQLQLASERQKLYESERATLSQGLAALREQAAAQGDLAQAAKQGGREYAAMQAQLEAVKATAPALAAAMASGNKAWIEEVKKLRSEYAGLLGDIETASQRTTAINAARSSEANAVLSREERNLAGLTQGQRAKRMAGKRAEAAAKENFPGLDQNDPEVRNFVNAQTNEATAAVDAGIAITAAANAKALREALRAQQELTKASRDGATAVEDAGLRNAAYAQSLEDGGLAIKTVLELERERARLAREQGANLQIERTNNEVAVLLKLAAANENLLRSTANVKAEEDARTQVLLGQINAADQLRVAAANMNAANAERVRGMSEETRMLAEQNMLRQERLRYASDEEASIAVNRKQFEIEKTRELASAQEAIDRARAANDPVQINNAEALLDALKRQIDVREQLLAVEQDMLDKEKLRSVKQQYNPDNSYELKQLERLRREYPEASDEIARAAEDSEIRRLEASTKTADGIERAIRKQKRDLSDFATQAEGMWMNMTSSMEDAWVKFAMTGQMSIKDLSRVFQEELLRMTFRMAQLQAMGGAGGGIGLFGKIASTVGSFFVGGGTTAGTTSSAGTTPQPMYYSPSAAAKGAIITGDGNWAKFYNGGIVSSRKTFQFNQGGLPGIGEVGEAGRSEGIVPLVRGPNGDMGVQMFGGSGGANVSIEVYDYRSNDNSSPIEIEQVASAMGPIIRIIAKDEAKKAVDNFSQKELPRQLKSTYNMTQAPTNRG